MTPSDSPGQKSVLARNTLANYGGTIFGFLYGVFLTPFMIRTLGNTLYGTWTVVMSISGYLALLDLGLGSALSKYAAEYEQRGETDAVNQLTSTLLFTFAGIGIVGLAFTAWLAPWFRDFFKIPDAYRGAAIAATILLGLNLVFVLIFNVYNALAIGFQRYDITNLAKSAYLIISALLTVGVLLLGGDLVALAGVACVATIAQILLVWHLFRRWVRPVPVRWRSIRKPWLKLLLSYSAFILVMMACNRIEQMSRPLLVGRLIGIDAVAYYAVGDKLSVLVRQASLPVAAVLFPSFAALSARNSPHEYGKLLVTGMRYATLIGLPVAVFPAILAGPLIAAWIGPEYTTSSTVAILLIGQAFVAQQLVAASSLLNGIGRLGLYTALHIFAVCFSIGFAILLTPSLGMKAVAAGSLIAWSAVLVATLVYTCRLSELHTGNLLRAAWLRPGLATAFVGIGLSIFAWYLPPKGLVQVALQGGTAGLAYLLIAWVWCLEPSERHKINGIINRRRLAKRSRIVTSDDIAGN